MLLVQRSLFEATPADRRATLISLGVAFAFIVLLMVIAALSGRGRKNSVRPILVFVCGILAGLAGLSLYADTRPAVPGIVVDRSERIVRRDAFVEGEYRLHVEYAPPGHAEARTESVPAGLDLYDRYAEGDTVAVRFVDLGGVLEFVRLAERTTFSMIDPSMLLLPALLVFLLGGTALAVHVTGRGRLWLPGIVLACVLMLSAYSVGQMMLLLPVGEPAATATADVTSVSSHAARPRGNSRSVPVSFIQSIDIIEFEFTPPGRQDPIVAIDAVDTGSHEAVAGGAVAVAYRADRPRRVRLATARRSHAWKNTLHLWVLYFVVAPVLVWWMARPRRR
jgi:hypothetical protein